MSYLRTDEGRLVVVLAVVPRGSQVLLVQRSKPENIGSQILHWALPGGKVDISEDPEQAVLRELYEETGIKATATQLISTRDHPDPYVNLRYYHCTSLVTPQTSFILPAAVVEVRWVEIAELPEFLSTDLDSGVAAFLKTASD